MLHLRAGDWQLLNLMILVCWMLHKQNIQSTKLNMLTLDIVLWLLCALHLALWDHLQFDSSPADILPQSPSF